MAQTDFRTRVGLAHMRARAIALKAVEISREEGVRGIIDRAQRRLGSAERMAAGRSASTQLAPLDESGAAGWPLSLAMVVGPTTIASDRARQFEATAKDLQVPCTVVAGVGAEARSLQQFGAALLVVGEPDSDVLQELSAEARRLRQPLVVDVSLSPSTTYSAGWLASLHGSDHVLTADSVQARAAKTSTRARVHVVEDSLDPDLAALLAGVEADPLVRRMPDRLGLQIISCVVTGFSGDNFPGVLGGVLADSLARHAPVALQVIGTTELPATLVPHRARIFSVGSVWRGERLRLLSASSVVVASPRHPDSSIALDAASLRLPLVAAPGISGEAIIDGATGLVADTTEQWTASLDRLISSPAYRSALGDAAWQHAQRWASDALPRRQFESLLAAIQESRA